MSADHKVEDLDPASHGQCEVRQQAVVERRRRTLLLEGPLDGVKKALKALVEIAPPGRSRKRLKSRKCRRSRNASLSRLRRLRTVAPSRPAAAGLPSGSAILGNPSRQVDLETQPIPDDAIIAREPEDALSQAALTVER